MNENQRVHSCAFKEEFWAYMLRILTYHSLKLTNYLSCSAVGGLICRAVSFTVSLQQGMADTWEGGHSHTNLLFSAGELVNRAKTFARNFKQLLDWYEYEVSLGNFVWCFLKDWKGFQEATCLIPVFTTADITMPSLARKSLPRTTEARRPGSSETHCHLPCVYQRGTSVAAVQVEFPRNFSALLAQTSCESRHSHSRNTGMHAHSYNIYPFVLFWVPLAHFKHSILCDSCGQNMPVHHQKYWLGALRQLFLGTPVNVDSRFIT